MTATQDDLLRAILPHVAFEGWSRPAFEAACRDLEISVEKGRSICPRGAVDLAAQFHRDGDRTMASKVIDRSAEGMRFRDRVEAAVLTRIEVVATQKEAVRRGLALFALPQHSVEGAALLWGTADAIWNALADTSKDYNWYTKRISLSAVYGSTILIWLGDEDPELAATKAFLSRRITDVMEFEKFKGKVNGSPFGKALNAGLGDVLSRITAPQDRKSGFPGSLRNVK